MGERTHPTARLPVLPAKLRSLVRLGMVHLLSGAFPRNRFPEFCSSIMQGHYLNPWGMKNALVVWRDVMVSWYHHCLFPNERYNTRLVDEVCRELHFEDYGGDWRNQFTREVFDKHAGRESILLGYERDRSWAKGDLGE